MSSQSNHYRLSSFTNYTPRHVMTADEFKLALKTLDITEEQAASYFGLSTRQIQFYRDGSRSSNGNRIPTPVPMPLTLLIRLMIKHDIHPDDLS